MPLNRAKGRMFKSVGWTWNPVVGCTHNCEYCWAKALRNRWGKPFEPCLQESAFKDVFPNDGTIIFVGSMGDLFCKGMKEAWIERVINKASEAHNNRFLFQTKNPHGLIWHLPDFDKISKEVVLGTTLETNRDTPWSDAPTPTERYYWLRETLDEYSYRSSDIFLSLEPLAEFDLETLTYMVTSLQPIAVEIGLENYGNILPRPTDDNIRLLLEELRQHNIHYILKENLQSLEESMNES